MSFDTQIRPILESRCQPCHFEGGKMYAELPFDRAQTIHDLGEKLFTASATSGSRLFCALF